LLQAVDAAARGGKGAGRKARPGNAVIAATLGANLARRGAANDLNPGKQTPHFLSEHLQIVFAGAEEHHQCHFRLRHRGVKFARGLARVGRARLSPAYSGPVLHVGLLALSAPSDR